MSANIFSTTQPLIIFVKRRYLLCKCYQYKCDSFWYVDRMTKHYGAQELQTFSKAEKENKNLNITNKFKGTITKS